MALPSGKTVADDTRPQFRRDTVHQPVDTTACQPRYTITVVVRIRFPGDDDISGHDLHNRAFTWHTQMHPHIRGSRPLGATFDSQFLDRVAGFAQPGRIEDSNRKSFQIHPDFDHIPSRPGYVRGQSGVAPSQTVQQGRFPGIRRPDDRHLEPVSDTLANAHALGFGAQIIEDAGQQGHHFGHDIDRDIFIDEIDRRFDQRSSSDQPGAPCLGLFTQCPGKNAQGLNSLALRFSVDQVGQTFHLSQIEPPVLHRSPCELAGFGHA
ncbi:MAG: hypothetical protein HLUCCA08_03125 [Rhodobacteraceae bacterium HLUCCA08]|nr:MAG: hypothetical protein HLUCCA08_03125 [Rhodobacteraceae bacterium HLUCCA08]